MPPKPPLKPAPKGLKPPPPSVRLSLPAAPKGKAKGKAVAKGKGKVGKALPSAPKGLVRKKADVTKPSRDRLPAVDFEVDYGELVLGDLIGEGSFGTVTRVS